MPTVSNEHWKSSRTPKPQRLRPAFCWSVLAFTICGAIPTSLSDGSTNAARSTKRRFALRGRSESVEGEALALSGLGDAYYLRGQMRTAGEQFRACVKLCHEHALRRVEVANRHMIGWTRLHLMELLEAEKDALASVQMATEVSHPRAQLLGLMLAGSVNCEMGQLEKADHFLQQAVELAQSIHADNFLANSLQFLAENSLAQGDKAKAQAYAFTRR